MKVHYINVLLFALPLNILAHNQRNHKSTTPHTRKIPTTRLLCECELYAPANYDNDPQMREVMENFNKQTQQRFHEYDDRMKSKRMQCKDKCDKEVQKIILKDKLEKQMAKQLSTLETKIGTDDIPTCVCEKSLADKVEKGCLQCAQNLGGIVVPSAGVIGEIASLSLSAWKNAAITSAIDFATKKGIQAGTQVGIQSAIQGVMSTFDLDCIGGVALDKLFTAKTFKDQMFFVGKIVGEYNKMVDSNTVNTHGVFSYWHSFFNGNTPKITQSLSASASDIARRAGKAATKMTTDTTNAITAEKTSEILSITTNYSTAIISSVVAIMIMVIIMVIIYLILRYRRKKKMKKKLQYIKLLKE
ncbi:PIR protein [Plasmodium reichenowi]|uniref:PIR protein n=1 Tax=Plasmodium reichenowi TaxID=5854 RepID=A0A2P9DRW1_PLARE|nr:PIR protein [Plasmodium reichenowi]